LYFSCATNYNEHCHFCNPQHTYSEALDEYTSTLTVRHSMSIQAHLQWGTRWVYKHTYSEALDEYTSTLTVRHSMSIQAHLQWDTRWVYKHTYSEALDEYTSTLTVRHSMSIQPSDQTSTLGLDGGRTDISVSSSSFTGP